MKFEYGRRGSCRGLAFGAALVLLCTAGCRESKKEEPTSAAAASAPASAAAEAPTASSIASTTAAAAPEPELVALGDAGADAGRPRRLRRLTAGAASAGAPEAVQAGAPVAAEPLVAAEPRRPAPKTPSAMADDLPYGGAAGSGAAVLKKTPLPTDDPWARSGDAAR